MAEINANTDGGITVVFQTTKPGRDIVVREDVGTLVIIVPRDIQVTRLIHNDSIEFRLD